MNNETYNTLEAVDLGTVTELDEAIKKDDLDQFRVFISKFSEPDEELVDVIEQALQKNASSIIQYLITQKAALVLVARQGRADTVAHLIINYKTDVHCVDRYDKTALLWAAQGGHTTTVEVLIDCNADVHCLDRYDKTALIWAAEGGYTATVDLLLKHKAAVNFPDQYGNTALILAAQGGHTTTVEVLLQHGANVNQPNNAHDTALALVIGARREAIVKLLAQADGLTDAGQTHRAVAKLLLQAGALTDDGQKDQLVDWPDMREFRATLYNKPSDSKKDVPVSRYTR